jgi:RHH-type proline utilization regulon transcriptional repressor/proline dehydrogenase/delta 1-pyrroline-5-carboxylate dehydrogenase
MTATAAPALTAFHASHAPDDDRLIREFSERLAFTSSQERAIDARATKLIQAIRTDSGQMGGVEDFLREYGLSTREGLALMVLAEALLRVPDALTQDRLIEDKLKEGGWSEHEGHGDTWFVSASAWALGMSARVIKPGETPEGVMRGLVKRMGMPTVRTATRQAMRFLGHHFVLGETIGEALNRAAKNEARGFRHSYDMLGEGRERALTPSDISSPMPMPSRPSESPPTRLPPDASCRTVPASRSSSRRCTRAISQPTANRC